MRDVLSKKVPEVQAEVKEFRKQHGKTKVGEITVDMVSKGLIIKKFQIFMMTNLYASSGLLF